MIPPPPRMTRQWSWHIIIFRFPFLSRRIKCSSSVSPRYLYPGGGRMHRGRAFERLRGTIAGGGCIKNCEIAGNNLPFEKLLCRFNRYEILLRVSLIEYRLIAIGFFFFFIKLLEQNRKKCKLEGISRLFISRKQFSSSSKKHEIVNSSSRNNNVLRKWSTHRYKYSAEFRISFIYVSVNKPRTKTGVHDSITIANTKPFVAPGKNATLLREKAARFHARWN